MEESEYVRLSSMGKVYIGLQVVSEMITTLKVLGEEFEGELADLVHAYEALDATWNRLLAELEVSVS